MVDLDLVSFPFLFCSEKLESMFLCLPPFFFSACRDFTKWRVIVSEQKVHGFVSHFELVWPSGITRWVLAHNLEGFHKPRRQKIGVSLLPHWRQMWFLSTLLKNTWFLGRPPFIGKFSKFFIQNFVNITISFMRKMWSYLTDKISYSFCFFLVKFSCKNANLLNWFSEKCPRGFWLVPPSWFLWCFGQPPLPLSVYVVCGSPLTTLVKRGGKLSKS